MYITWHHLLFAGAIAAILSILTFTLGRVWQYAATTDGAERTIRHLHQLLVPVKAALDNGHDLGDGHRRRLTEALDRLSRAAHKADPR